MSGPDVVREPAREVSVLGRWDVVVCGGGPAGCAAALGAARHGARVLLLELEGHPGGAPVTQLVFPILSTNGHDFQGLWHTWARRLLAMDGIAPMRRHARFGGNWYVSSVHPETVKYAWEHLLAEAGVDVLYHALCAGALVEDGVIGGVFLETRAGRRAVRAGRVIDCTGDGVVCAAAGVSFESGALGRPWAMGVGMMFRFGGLPVAPEDEPALPAQGFGRASGPPADMRMQMKRTLKVDPLDPWDLTRASREGRAMGLECLSGARARHGDSVYLVDSAPRPGVRSSRRIKGLCQATAEDVYEFNKYADGIARGSWEVDIHKPDQADGHAVQFEDPQYRRRIERAMAGDWYDIRYGCLVVDGVDNLLVAGRCLSAEHQAQSSLRIQQTCLGTGEAAGVAAALSLSADLTPRALEAQAVVDRLAVDRDVEPAFAMLRDLPVYGG